MAYIACKVVKVAIGPEDGNRVAHLVERGALVPDGVSSEALDRLARRGLIKAVESPEASGPDTPADAGGSTDMARPDGRAGVEKWKAYAEHLGLTVPDDADKDAIKVLVDAHEKAAADPK